VKFFLSGEPNSVMRMTRKKGWSLLVEMKKVKKM
jgi:hypothetical protein